MGINNNIQPKARVFAICIGLSSAFLMMCSTSGPVDVETVVGELESKIPEVIINGITPSLQIAVVHDNQVIWSEALGDSTSIDHIYMNGSVQKVFDAFAVLQLVEQGKLDLNSDINEYIPFDVKHPEYTDVPVTTRMLVTHKSGMDFGVPHQFEWDTACFFTPRFRPDCRTDLSELSLEEFLIASLTPEGSNYDKNTWKYKPGDRYKYCVTTAPLVRYMIGRISGLGYPEYMRRNIFEPLNMLSSGFRIPDLNGPIAIPHTRMDSLNVELPVWDGNGHIMRTTAEDMAKFLIAFINGGEFMDKAIIRPESVKFMQKRSTRFGATFQVRRKLEQTGHGFGLFIHHKDWYGCSGSTPGYQTIWKYNPTKKVGFVIMTNINAILGGDEYFPSAQKDIYNVQRILVSILE